MSSSPLECLEILTGPEPVAASVIWLHGLGADCHDFEPIVPELVEASFPTLRFVFPDAPIRPISLNGGLPMRGWYDISLAGGDIERDQDTEGIRDSAAALEALLARERERGVTSGRIFLAGFSQGGAIALHVGLRSPETLGGIIALSTYLPLHDTLESEKTAAGLATPVFQAHGTHDPVIPVALGDLTRRFIAEKGARIRWETYPMQHAVCQEEIDHLRGWLKERLGS